MIKGKLTVLLLCGVLCVTGCSQNKETDAETDSTSAQQGTTEAATSVDDFDEYEALFKNAKDTNVYDEEYEGSVQVTFGKYTAPNSTLTYNGEALQLEFSGEASWGTTFGYLVYINGIPQKYHTDASEEELYLHAVPLEKDKKKKVTLFIHPGSGKAGEELDMLIVAVLASGYRPLGPHDTVQPEGDAGTYRYWYKVKMEADAAGSDSYAVSVIDTLTDYTDYELSKLIYTLPDGSLRNDLENAGFKNIHNRTVIEDKKLRLFTQFGGGEENATYMISAYLNGRVLKTWQVTLKDYKSRAVIDEVFTFTDEMLKEYDVSDYNSYYYMAVPLDKKTNNGQQKQSARGIVVSGKEVLQ